jgi:tripartite-type tricarboxylate transporter receptor subunit TctC
MFCVSRKWLTALALACGALGASAQTYPTKPVRLIVPVEAGSATDVVARLVAQRLSIVWSQQVVVDNRPSVNGVVGVELAAHVPADGYTLLAGNSGTHVMNVGLYKKLSYDPVADFAPVAQLVTTPLVLVGSPKMPPRTVKEVIAYAKTNSINFGIAGATGQLSSLMFNAMAGVNVVSIPYKGSAGAENSLLAGDTQLFFASISNAMPYATGNRLTMLGVTSLKRSPLLPDVPTLDESGLKDYEMDYWVGLFAPAATPRPLLDRIHADVVRAMSSPEVKERLAQMGYTEPGRSRGEFDQYVRTSATKYGKLMRELGVKAQ